MPSFTNNTLGAGGKSDPLAGVRALEGAHQSLVAQMNSTPALVGITNGVYPNNLVPGSLSAEAVNGGIQFGVADSTRTIPQTFMFSENVTHYLGFVHHTGDPTVADFPTDEDFGWFRNDTSGAYAFVLNDAGSVVYPNLTYISGQISLSQHGDLSGLGGGLHDFTQIRGTITATQHAAQTLASLHAVATTSANGFASAAQITQLNTATSNIASIQTTVTDITSTGTASNILNCTHLDVSGTKVVGARQTGWSNISTTILRDGSGMAFTGTPPVADFTASNFNVAVHLLFSVINDLANHGLIGT